jgi:hypothetical protein
MQITANFSGRQKRQLGDLLMELRGQPLDSSLQGPLSPTHIVVRDEQESWRAEFRQWLQARCQQGLCVVGNGGTLLGAGLGRWIDSHGVVVRFNRFQGAASTAVDIGHRLDVWVTSADQDIAVPSGVPWIVVSGPEMAFRLQNWGRFADSLSSRSKVLTVPLPPWRELVAELQAPPSAGLLFLAWARSLMGGWTSLQAVGFAGVRAGARPYHHANIRHRPGARHHWAAELQVLRRWQEEGLHIELPA